MLSKNCWTKIGEPKSKFLHHMKDILHATTHMLLHTQNYARYKTFGQWCLANPSCATNSLPSANLGSKHHSSYTLPSTCTTEFWTNLKYYEKEHASTLDFKRAHFKHIKEFKSSYLTMATHAFGFMANLNMDY